MRQTIEEESSPPERQDPTGASERRCRRTESVSSDRNCSAASASESRSVPCGGIAYQRFGSIRPVQARPAAIATQQPGWSWTTPSNSVSSVWSLIPAARKSRTRARFIRPLRPGRPRSCLISEAKAIPR